jgi:C_GCAxxG_C_C family probable redox protein
MDKNQQVPAGLAPNWVYWGQSASNLARMGHCAPTVMKTILDGSGTKQEWLVKLIAGMPGGIGNTGFECGAVTAPLVLMGLRYGLHETDQGLPVIVDRGQGLCQRFLQCHSTLQCRQIRGKDRFPKHCIRPVCLSPQMFFASTANHHQSAIPAEIRALYCRLYSHWEEQNFHCARAVLEHLPAITPARQELLDAVSAFMGGTLFMGMTCSAFAAGVMAVGLRSGEIENSPIRVIRMLYRMTTGGDAFDEKINKFNRSMNAGYRMSRWFTKEFGSTQCREITGCDFSTGEGVGKYIQSGCLTRCKLIAQKVVEKIQKTYQVSE